MPVTRLWSKSDRRPTTKLISLSISVYVILAVPLPSLGSDQNDCITESTCGACIQKPGCAWCSQPRPEFNDTFSRCDKPENLREECPTQYLEFPQNEQEYLRNDDFRKGTADESTVQLKPQRIKLKLRLNEPYNITFEYKRAQDYPIDLYYLMDLSNSMEDDKNTVAKLGASLAEMMQNLTTNFTLGFGSFVDKLTLPFVSTSPGKLKLPCKGCVPPFSFRNNLPLNANASRFEEEVNRARVSGNLDAPEGGFDALMQALVCKKEIGWRNNVRRVIIFSTDSAYHFAGDGKLGGILDPHDGKCHLDAKGEYTHSTILDYPSIAQINSKIQQESVTVIFAVISVQMKTYTTLAELIPGSTAAELSNTSSNVVELVRQEYEKITSELKFTDDVNNDVVKLKYFVNCGGESGSGSMVPGRSCRGVKKEQNVLVQAQIRIEKCPENRTQSFDIKVVGFEEKLTVDLDIVSDCACEMPGSPGYELKSPLCSGTGTSVCGACSCDEQRYGRLCQCDRGPNSNFTEGSPEELRACQQDPATKIVCSNRGSCSCGECQCSSRPNRNETITGKFCECDNYTCRQYLGQLCSGPDHGSCVCKKCECNAGWSGSACECSTAKDGCFEPGNAEICNGRGTCKCNRCQCEASSSGESYSGRYCENCQSCPDKCSQLAPCVQCKVHRNATSDAEIQACAVKCQRQPEAQIVDVATSDEVNGEKYCSFQDDSDGCTFFYVYGYNSNGKLYVNAQLQKYCPLVQPLTGIIGGVVIGTLIIGLVILGLIKYGLYVKDKREWTRFEKERASAKFDKGENPLYRDPNSMFHNPVYGGRDQ